MRVVIGGFVLAETKGAANATTTNDKITRAVIPLNNWAGTIVADTGSATRSYSQAALVRGHFEFERNFFSVEVVTAAVNHANGIGLVEDADDAETAFAARRFVNALAVGAAFD